MSDRLSVVIDRPAPPFETGTANGAAAEFGILFDALAVAANGVHYALRRRNRYQVSIYEEYSNVPLHTATFTSYRAALEAARELSNVHSIDGKDLNVTDVTNKRNR